MQTSGLTPNQGSSSSSGISQTDNELGMKIEMVAPPDELSTGIVAVTIPQSTAVAGRIFVRLSREFHHWSQVHKVNFQST